MSTNDDITDVTASRTEPSELDSSGDSSDDAQRSRKRSGSIQSANTPHRTHKQHKVNLAHGKLGARNPSYGRNLSKIAATPTRDGEGAVVTQYARTNSIIANGSPLLSPRLKSAKRSQPSLVHLAKQTSHVTVRKNSSSAQLLKAASSKKLDNAARPSLTRVLSHPGTTKSKRKKSPTREGRRSSVRFAMGEDDGEADEMDDVEPKENEWVETSAPQSPSANLPDKPESQRQSDKGEFKGQTNITGRLNEDTTLTMSDKDASSSRSATKVSSSAKLQDRFDAGDEDDDDNTDVPSNLGRRMGQDINNMSAMKGNSESKNTSQLEANQSSSGVGTEGSAELISRFIDESSTSSSKDGFKNVAIRDGTSLYPDPESDESTGEEKITPASRSSTDLRAATSTMDFLGYSAMLFDGGSGATTPGGPLRPSRTQQKLWLQRGLSHIEAKSQQNLPGMLGAGKIYRGGTILNQSERIDTELKAVRRFYHPIEDSIERLKKLKDSPIPNAATSLASGTQAGSSAQKMKQKDTKSKSTGLSSVIGSPAKFMGKSITSFVSSPIRDPDLNTGTSPLATSVPRSEASVTMKAEDQTKTPRRLSMCDWPNMTLDEIEEATLGIRRQLWDLQIVGGSDD